MEITIYNDGSVMIMPENDNEKDYVKTVLNRCKFAFDPTFIIWTNGICIKGKGKEKRT